MPKTNQYKGWTPEQIVETNMLKPYYPYLLEYSKWSGFAKSLLDQMTKGLAPMFLTEKQERAVNNMIQKVEANKGKTKESKTTKFERLAHHFLTAASEVRWPKLRLVTKSGQKVVLSRAGSNSRTPGHIHVTDGGPYGANRYFGRIRPNGAATLRHDIPEEVVAELTEWDKNPEDAVKASGDLTGHCCLCGRQLTNPESIERGIARYAPTSGDSDVQT